MHEITIRSLSQSFNKGSLVNCVLRDITLSLYQQTSYALMGVSGSGKTTLLSLLAGLITPTTGAIYLDGKPIGDIDQSEYLNKHIGIVFQQPYLLNELSVIENVMLKGLIAQKGYAESKDEALYLLEQVDMAAQAGRSPRELSGGEQQRVAIARAIFAKPSFLLADEPTAHLDDKNKMQILALLKKIHVQNNMGLIIATHDAAVSSACDETLCISGGSVTVATK